MIRLIAAQASNLNTLVVSKALPSGMLKRPYLTGIVRISLVSLPAEITRVLMLTSQPWHALETGICSTADTIHHPRPLSQEWAAQSWP